MEFMTTHFPNLVLGFATAISPINLLYCFTGVFIGTVVGVLPGIGPMAAMAMLLPATYSLSPVGGLIMLAGIFYGTQYGGSTTAILIKIPGESASVVTCIDGHEMAKQGRAGPALATAAVGSFFAGTVCTLLIAVAGPPLSEVALKFLAPEYFSLMVMGLIASTLLAHGNMLKAVASIVLGLILGIVGTDVNTGMFRFTFGVPALSDGLSVAVVAMGLFGYSEILSNIGKGKETESRALLSKKIHGLMPTWADIKVSAGAILRGTGIGAFFGTLPGAGPTISAFAS
jgi:TctA family transporter